MAATKSSATKAAKKATPARGGRRGTASKAESATKAVPVKAATKKASAAKTATTKTATTKTATTKRTPAKRISTSRTASKSPQASPMVHAVPVGEEPWTKAEIAEVRALLESDMERLQVEISAVEEEIGHLLREGGEGAGHDQADVGSNTFERDHEMSIAKNARENLVLVTEAIARIDEGGYGICESCGKPIAKMRLQAFPRATLCMECKQRQERR